MECSVFLPLWWQHGRRSQETFNPVSHVQLTDVHLLRLNYTSYPQMRSSVTSAGLSPSPLAAGQVGTAI